MEKVTDLIKVDLILNKEHVEKLAVLIKEQADGIVELKHQIERDNAPTLLEENKEIAANLEIESKILFATHLQLIGALAKKKKKKARIESIAVVGDVHHDLIRAFGEEAVFLEEGSEVFSIRVTFEDVGFEFYITTSDNWSDTPSVFDDGTYRECWMYFAGESIEINDNDDTLKIKDIIEIEDRLAKYRRCAKDMQERILKVCEDYSFNDKQVRKVLGLERS